MIDLGKLQLGDVVYHIDCVTTIDRKRITMTDADGVKWFRYDRPIRLYNIHELMYVGSVIKIIRGKTTDFDDHRDEYYFEYKSTGNLDYYCENDPFFEACHLTLEAAQQHVNELKEQDHDY